MAEGGADPSVTIGEETFSLVTIPQAETRLVQKAKLTFLGELDLESLVDDLSKLGKYIRIAYNGVAGNTELQIKVQRVGYKIAKLTDESAVTVHKFRKTSNNILQLLKGTYQLFLDGLEKMAQENLSSLANTADAMAKAAEELQKKFEEATNDVVDALEDTQRAKGAEEDRKKQLKEQWGKMKLQIKEEEMIKKDASEAIKMAEELYKEAQKKEDEALEKQQSLTYRLGSKVSTFINFIFKWSLVSKESAIKEFEEKKDVAKEDVQKANSEKMKHLEEMQKQRDIRREANKKCIEFTEKIENCNDDEILEEVTIDALHNSVGALKSLSAIMMNAVLFWRQMHAHCQSLAGDDMQRMIENAMKYPEKKRPKVWTSTSFKTKGILFYSEWVALDDVCGIYMAQIKKTRQDLYDYLQENPTIEEARKNVRQLAASFGDELKKAQQEIDDKDSEASQEMKALKQSNEQ